MALNSSGDEQPSHNDDDSWDEEENTEVFETIDDTPVKVRDGIFIGTFMAEQNKSALQKAGVTHILQVADGLEPSHPEDFQYCSVHIQDASSEDLVSHFDKCFQFMERAQASKGSVLVHCVAGVSRSATVIIGYLMWKEKCGYQPAFQVLHAVRPWICPNNGFKAQLKEFEELGCDVHKWSTAPHAWKAGANLAKRSASDDIDVDDFM